MSQFLVFLHLERILPLSGDTQITFVFQWFGSVFTFSVYRKMCCRQKKYFFCLQQNFRPVKSDRRSENQLILVISTHFFKIKVCRFAISKILLNSDPCFVDSFRFSPNLQFPREQTIGILMIVHDFHHLTHFFVEKCVILRLRVFG